MRRDDFMRRILACSAIVLIGLAGGCADDRDDSSPSNLPADEVVQPGCGANADCPGGRCVEGLPGGLCTANCGDDLDCPEGTVCTDTEAVGGVCLFPCTSAGECRDRLGDGYTCDSESSLVTGEDVRVCIDA